MRLALSNGNNTLVSINKVTNSAWPSLRGQVQRE